MPNTSTGGEISEMLVSHMSLRVIYCCTEDTIRCIIWVDSL